MDLVHQLLTWLRDPGELVRAYGYAGIALIIFLETGALTFFLPGDSLLVTAGLFAAKGDLNILWLNLMLIPLAILGDAVSYLIGSHGGARLFQNPNAKFLKPKYLQMATEFYERHGGKAIIISRFVPIVRTFVPVVAGMTKMPYMRFATYNVVGGAAWVMSMTLIGYTLGSIFPGIAKRIELLVMVVVFLSILPAIFEWWKHRMVKESRAS